VAGSPGSSKRCRGFKVGALALGLCLSAGAAYAYFTSSGSGSGQASVGSPVVITVNATSGTPDLVPGGTGAVYFTLTNTNDFGVVADSVMSASVVSNDTADCPSANISIVPSLPYAVSPALSVSANSISGTESIAGFVELSSSAPTGCQGVTFTVTLVLSGNST